MNTGGNKKLLLILKSIWHLEISLHLESKKSAFITTFLKRTFCVSVNTNTSETALYLVSTSNLSKFPLGNTLIHAIYYILHVVKMCCNT